MTVGTVAYRLLFAVILISTAVLALPMILIVVGAMLPLLFIIWLADTLPEWWDKLRGRN